MSISPKNQAADPLAQLGLNGGRKIRVAASSSRILRKIDRNVATRRWTLGSASSPCFAAANSVVKRAVT